MRLLRERELFPCEDTQVVRGKIDNRTVEVLHTGVGENSCRRRLATFLQREPFDLLISTGFAGALDERLKPGDLVLAENFSTVKLDQTRALLSELKVHEARFATISRIIESPEERAELARSTDASAVDMETDVVARLCAEHAVPLLALRAISDTPARPFPAPAGVLFDLQRQKSPLSRLGFFLLTHPARLPRMLRFARQVRMARRAVTRGLETLLRSEWL